VSEPDAIKLERDAVLRLEAAIATIKADLGWYWHWGDGRGAFVLEQLAAAVREEGYCWPDDDFARIANQRRKTPISRALAKKVFERDAYRCVTCDGYSDLTCDHIIPESKGGPTTFGNLQTMCRPCNSRKGNRV